MTDTFEVSLWRGNAAGRYHSYEVPRRDNQTVLDVVTFVQRHLDATLSYRFACRVGMCGSCAMTVNGRPRWTCRTHVSKVAVRGRLIIGPLANLPIIKDLAVDMTEFFAKWQAGKGAFVPPSPTPSPFPPPQAGEGLGGGRPGGSGSSAVPIARIAPDSPARRAADAAIECINCAVCYAACDTVRWNPSYLGPAALNRAWTLVNDERDAANPQRLAAIAADGGCYACHTHQSCQEHCPVGLNPTASIAGLKRRAVAGYLKGEIAA